jgi:hypothetical protein
MPNMFIVALIISGVLFVYLCINMFEINVNVDLISSYMSYVYLVTSFTALKVLCCCHSLEWYGTLCLACLAFQMSASSL